MPAELADGLALALRNALSADHRGTRPNDLGSPLPGLACPGIRPMCASTIRQPRLRRTVVSGAGRVPCDSSVATGRIARQCRAGESFRGKHSPGAGDRHDRGVAEALVRAGRPRTTAFVARRSCGVWLADVCFHDRDNATLPALTAGLSRSTEGRASPLALAGSRGCEPEQAGRHFGGAGASPREAAVLCPDAGSELHRLPHHRGDTAVSRPRRDEWSSSAAAVSLRAGRVAAPEFVCGTVSRSLARSVATLPVPWPSDSATNADDRAIAVRPIRINPVPSSTLMLRLRTRASRRGVRGTSARWVASAVGRVAVRGSRLVPRR